MPRFLLQTSDPDSASEHNAPDTPIVPSHDEEDDDPQLVAALDAENPLPALVALCASLLLRAPRVEVRKDPRAARGTVTMTLSRGDGAWWTSGPCTAASRRVAALLAARTLLAALTAAFDGAPRAAHVDADEEGALRTHNPKGRLLELCTQAHWDPPVFDVRPIADAFGGTARLVVGDATLTANARTARQVKLVEHALAAALFAQADGLAPAPETRRAAPPAPEATPHERLRALRREGKLWHFGVDLRPPTPTGVVVAEGWLLTPRYVRHVTPPVEGRSTKDADLRAARALLAVFDALGAHDTLPSPRPDAP